MCVFVSLCFNEQNDEGGDDVLLGPSSVFYLIASGLNANCY